MNFDPLNDKKSEGTSNEQKRSNYLYQEKSSHDKGSEDADKTSGSCRIKWANAGYISNSKERQVDEAELNNNVDFEQLIHINHNKMLRLFCFYTCKEESRIEFK